MSPMQQVIDQECERKDCRSIMGLLSTREMNMVGGRPSDCARSAARDHRLAGSCESFVAKFVPAAQLFGAFTTEGR